MDGNSSCSELRELQSLDSLGFEVLISMLMVAVCQCFELTYLVMHVCGRGCYSNAPMDCRLFSQTATPVDVSDGLFVCVDLSKMDTLIMGTPAGLS